MEEINQNPNPVISKLKLNFSVKEVFRTFKALVPTFVRVYWQALKRFLLWIALPGGIIYGFFYVFKNGDTIPGIIAMIGMIALVILGLAGILICVYLMIWLQVALIQVVRRRAEAIDAKQLFESARSLIGPYFWTSFVSGLLTILWTLLLIIPGLIFGVYYCLAPYIAMDENLKGYAAVKRSKELVKGLWWPVFGNFLIIILVTIVVYAAGFYIDKALGFDENDAGVASNLISIVFVPFAVTFEYLIYEKVKQAKS